LKLSALATMRLFILSFARSPFPRTNWRPAGFIAPQVDSYHTTTDTPRSSIIADGVGERV
jgi:hypothetical protein